MSLRLSRLASGERAEVSASALTTAQVAGTSEQDRPTPYLRAHRPDNRRWAKPRGKAVIRFARPKLKDAALVLGAVALFVAIYVAALALVGAQALAETQPQVTTCHTVTAKTYNKRVRLLDTITGKRHHRASRKVCKHTIYKRLGMQVRKARASCKRSAITTGATWYGGPGDSMTSGTAGAYGDLSNHPWSFAELNMGKAMGGLKPLSWWFVHSHVNGKTKRAQKRDIGGGGGPIGNYTRGLDAWHPLAQYLDLMGNGIVTLAKHNCWAK